ncbi:MAG: hypothetical protein QXR45_08800 [Candidatus Bathyarchaeia archaeon]
MSLKYVYDSSQSTENRQKIVSLLGTLEKKGMHILRIDTANWDQNQCWSFYLNELLPLSVLNKKKLRGRVRTHKAGGIYLRDVLITEKEFFIDEEVIIFLEKLMEGKE